MCGVGQYCVASACVDGQLTISIDPFPVLTDVPVVITGQVVRSTNNEVLPASVLLTSATLVAAPSATVAANGRFSFLLAARLGQFGTKALDVSFATANSGVLRSIPFMVDAPALVVVPPVSRSYPTNASWDLPPAITRATPRVEDTIVLNVITERPEVVVRLNGSQAVDCGQCFFDAGCKCRSLLSLPFNPQRLTETYTAQFAANDGSPFAGKFADGGAPEVTLTRVLWQLKLDAGVITAPVIANDGTLLLALAAPTPAIRRVTRRGELLDGTGPDGGPPVLPLPRLPFSLALDPGTSTGIGDDVVYAAGATDDGGFVSAFFVADGGLTTFNSEQPVRTAMALVEFDGGFPRRLGAVAHLSATGAFAGQLVQVAPGLISPPFVLTDDLFETPIPTPVQPLSNLAVARAAGAPTSTLFSLARTSTTEAVLSPRGLGPFGTFFDLGLSGPPLSTAGVRVAASDAGAAVTTASRVLFDSVDLFDGGGPYSPATFDRAGGLWVGTGNGIVWRGLDGGTATLFNNNVELGLVHTATRMFGAANRVYGLSRNGRLLVVDSSGAAPVPLWSDRLPLPGAGFVWLPLTLDCYRESSNRIHSLLYVVQEDTVTAVIVQGNSVDQRSPWPMHQHDPFLSGNSSLGLDLNCPQ